ncbi:WhiB family transcriptional regulator [Streptomyces sp. URMC 123]|uniref:WhiB family transcriptional regulator n=1 Tax=Streptomyces sp. URMC 123 TaxID=3423403 RepID=UPI003F1AAD26
MNCSSVARTHTCAPVATAAPHPPRAACADEDPELFFPVGESASALLQTEEAKAICRRCPLEESCLREALARGERFGVWGGTDAEERRRMTRCAARDPAHNAS